jgi:hypothetical protein
MYIMFNPNGYPINAFPEKALQAFQELAANTQAPYPLIGGSLLAAMAYACQRRVRVRRRPGLESSVTLYLLSIAESGERKSVIDALTTRSIRDLEAKGLERFKQSAVARAVEQQVHRVKRAMLLADLRERLRRGEDVWHIEKDLGNLEADCPRSSQPPRLVYADATSEALLQGLYAGWNSAIVLASEGGLFLEGHAMRRISILNMLATGEVVTVDRKSGPSFVLRDATLSISVMVQPKVFEQFCRKREDSARGSGMWTRFLFSRPISTQGGRFLMAPNAHWDHVNAFNDRTRALLEDPEHPGTLLDSGIRTLDLDPDAQIAWTEFFNAVESELTPWGFLADARDYGSRIAEQVARIAAIFHEFQGLEGPINLASMQRAIDVGKWYLQEFVSIFGAGGTQDVVLDDSLELHRHLNLVVMRTGRWALTKSSLRQRGPLRDTARLREALDLMAARDLLRMFMVGRTLWIELNNLYFGHPIQANVGALQLKPTPPPLPFAWRP